MSLAGAVRDFGVGEIFQLIGQQRKTGVLEITHGDLTVEVHFHEGMVLRARPVESRPDASLAAFLLRVGALAETDLAEARRDQQETLEALGALLEREGLLRKTELEAIARLLTEETLFELFFWDEGRFAFRSEPIEWREGDQALSAENVLLDALRMRDEWVAVRSALPDFTVVLAPATDVVGFSAQRATIEQASGLGGEALERLFRLVDRRSTLRRVIDLSRLGTFSGARGIVAMLQAGAVKVERARKLRAQPTRRRPGAATLGLLAVGGVGLLAGAIQTLTPAIERQSYPVPAATLANSREAALRERIAVLLEVHRWAHGSYPEHLEELSSYSWSLLARDVLARYSYQRAGDQYRLEQLP
jgi:hypothetical protein